MNFAQKKVLTIAVGLISIAFTAISLCTATVAWFAQNNKVDATGMNIKCKQPEQLIDLTYDVLKWDDDTKLGTSYGQDSTKIVLPEYDSTIPQKNEHSNVLVRLNADFSTPLATDGYVAFDIVCSGNLFKTVNSTSYIDDQTSNVINFKAVLYSYTLTGDTTPPSQIVTTSITDAYSEVAATNANARYTSATTFFDSIYTSTVYVSPANRGSSKISDKTVTIIPTIGSRATTIDSMVIYLELSYNYALADNYADTSYDANGGTIDLTGDVTTMSFYITDNPPTLDSVTLSTNAVSVISGASSNVTATSSGTVVWYAAEQGTGSVSLSNTSNTGATITGETAGKAVVSATTGQASAYLDATITRAVTQYVQLDKNTLTGLVGKTATLTATGYNFDNVTLTYTWTSSVATVATVSGSSTTGTVSYVGAGSTTITITISDGTHSAHASCSVTVTNPTITITGDETRVVAPGDINTLTTTVANFSGTPTYAWTSSVPAVATVTAAATSNMSVTAVATGTTVITVTATYGEEEATDTVTINVVNFSLDKSSLIGVKGGTDGSLTATAATSTGYTGTLTYGWTSSVANVVTINATANTASIVYDNYGSTVITCTLYQNGTSVATDTCSVTIGELTLNQSNLYVKSTADSIDITATLNGVSGTITWSWASSTAATATVSGTSNVGTVDYLAAGDTTITCTATYSGVAFTATCAVKVVSASIDNTTLSGTVGGSGTITVTATNFTGTLSYNSLTSSDTGVATVSRSSNVITVTYVAAGSSTVSFTLTDGTISYSFSCAVTVTTASSGYTKLTNISDVVTGDYVISAYDGTTYYGLPNTLSAAGKPTAVALSVTNDNNISTANASGFELTLTVSSGNVTIYSSVTSNYYASSSNTDIKVNTTGSNAWTITAGTNGTFRLVGVLSTTRALIYRNTDVFGCYAKTNATASSTQYYDLELFKYGG